jgi:pyruvate/2-oxoglutarate/acetoin dehydrogenase E1 component
MAGDQGFLQKFGLNHVLDIPITEVSGIKY